MPRDLGLDVSRETLDMLNGFESELLKWNKRINLISRSTVEDIWDRHIVDSAQLFRLKHIEDLSWTDLGSGGGLPGLVIAILAKFSEPTLKVTLIESDQRKAAFLRSITAQFQLNCSVIAERIEQADPQVSDIVSARALASLDDLLPLGRRHLREQGRLLFLKGKTAQQEIEKAKINWDFDVVEHPSLTDNQSRILEITNIAQKT